MGLRMYINEDTCFGKVYGYAGNNPHLYSIDYLCSIKAFDEWDVILYDTNSSADMIDYFDCTQATEDIFLTPEQFTRFIYLYISDGLAVWGPEHWSVEDSIDILKVMNDRIEREPDKKICIHWG